MKKLKVLIMCAMTLAGLIVLHAAIQARYLVLDSIKITEEFDCAIIKVSFNFPVRYIRHFPYESGGELRVEIKPIVTSEEDKKSLFTRESLTPPSNEVASLEEVLYEGNLEGGPFLTFYFGRTVDFKVEQGPDFRSIVVSASRPDSSRKCQLSH